MQKVLWRLVISLAFIALLFYLMRNDIPEILGAIRHANHQLIGLATVIFIASTVIFAKRLQMIFAAENIHLSLADLSNLTFVGYFFNNFLPTSVGGDIVKAMCATRLTKDPVKSVTTILMDRIFGLFSFVLIPSITLLFFLKQAGSPNVLFIVYFFLAAAIFCFFLLFNRNLARKFGFVEAMLKWVRLDKKARAIYDGLNQFKDRKKLIVAAMLLSIVGQLISLWITYLLGQALGSDAPAIYYFLLVPVVQLLAMLPSLNGLGIREGAYVYFMGPWMGKEKAFALGILWLAMLFVMSLIGAVIYLVRHDYHIQFKGASNELAS